MESGNPELVRGDADASVKLAPKGRWRATAALALARAGDTAGAEKLAAQLDKDFPLDTLVQRYRLPTIRAAVALQRKDPKRAIELLRAASAIELGEYGHPLSPVYLRGEAYLMLHDGNWAAAEFQVPRALHPDGFRMGRTGALATRESLRFVGRQNQGEGCVSGFPYSLERRRPRHPDPQESQGGIRQAVVSNAWRALRERFDPPWDHHHQRPRWIGYAQNWPPVRSAGVAPRVLGTNRKR